MNVNLLEWGRIEDFSVGHTIERHTSRQTNSLHSCSLREFFQHAEIDFFQARLERSSQVAMALLQRLVRRARRAEPPLHPFRKQFAERGSLVGFGPGHLRPRAMVRKVI